MPTRLLPLFLLLISSAALAQTRDTLVVQTLTYDSIGRAGYYHFPDTGTFEKVLLQYSMRCKHALISTEHAPNDKGCGEWDYNCETFIIDSSRTDSVKSTTTPGTYDKWPQKFELMSFVTPYGLGLDLGKTGKMWEFDVTDYLPIIKGWKRLSMERGAGQEEFDLKFLFIKGTPARNVIDMQQIWPMTEEAYQTIQAETRYEPREVWLNAAAKGFKLRSYITGHGQGWPNGEFQPQTHYLSVNGKMYEREVLKECSGDPLYPQGGTWPANRAGWCPGMATDLAEYEITGTVTPGDSAGIDYGVEGGVGDSRYDPSTQLVSYGAPNFALNPSIVRTLRPSERIEFARINPACDQPIVMIKNNGSQPLTSLTFEYYTEGGPHRVYPWSGNLKFLDTLSVTLPVDSIGFWVAPTGNFHVDISQPNGATDGYDADNHYTSIYKQPPQYNGIVVLTFRTNNHPEDNYYEITDRSGNTIRSMSDFSENTIYYDSLVLATGCYTMVLHDDGENGLYYWADTSQHNGAYLRFRQNTRTGKTLYTVQNDFGKFVQYDFSIKQAASSGVSDRVSYQRLSLYPNPASNILRVSLEGYPSQSITLEIVDERGTLLRREQRVSGSIGSMDAPVDVSFLPRGSYFLRITTKDGATTQPFSHQ
jgi:hypothetical protein